MDEPARTGRPVERHYQKRLALLYYGGMAKEKVIRGKQDDAAHDGLRSNRRREGEAQAVQLLASGETIVGEKIAYPAGAPAKVTAAILTLAPGASTGWHTHGLPTFGYILEGELTVDYGDKGRRVYRAGDALLEAIAIAHDGRNTGAGSMRILAVFMACRPAWRLPAGSRSFGRG